MGWGSYEQFGPYVSVAERKARAQKELARLAKKGGFVPSPVTVEGRAIARTFWGQRWCEHLESYADFASRLERGRTYVRNGSVVHLEVAPGVLRAKVAGSEVYDVEVTVQPLPGPRWSALMRGCAGKVASIVDLLAGKLSAPVLEVLCDRSKGLFPAPKEIQFDCSCPDGAWMCKHVAAVLYGVGARLDAAPELLFTLRKVDGSALVARAAKGLVAKRAAPKAALAADAGALAGLFGIELAAPAPMPVPSAPVRATKAKPREAAPARRDRTRRGPAVDAPVVERPSAARVRVLAAVARAAWEADGGKQGAKRRKKQ